MRKFILIFILPLLLMSCSTNPEITRIGPGVIKSETQLMTKEEVQKEQAKKGAEVGAATGAVTGAGTGAAVGLWAGALYGISFWMLCTILSFGLGGAACLSMMLPALGIGAGAGAGVGALVGAGAGSLVGAGGTYVYAAKKENIIGKYQYEVLPDGQDKTITFEQYPDKMFKTGERVDLFVAKYKDTTTYFIKPLEELKDSNNSNNSNNNNTNDKDKSNENKDSNSDKD